MLILPGCRETSALARGKLSPRASSMGPIQSAITQWGWGFHTLCTGINPEVLRFLPRVVPIIKIPKNVSSGDGKLSSPGASGPRRWPGGHLSLRASPMGPIQSSFTKWGWGFHTLFGGIDPGDLPFCPGVDLVVAVSYTHLTLPTIYSV